MTATLTIGQYRNLPADQRHAVEAWLRTFTVDHLAYPDCVTHVEVHDDGLVRIRVKEWDRSAGGGIRLAPDGKPYAITMANGSWSDGIERPERPVGQRDALLDHYLSRCKIDDEGRLALRTPPAEFPSIIERHGLWRDDLEELGRAGRASPAPPQAVGFRPGPPRRTHERRRRERI